MLNLTFEELKERLSMLDEVMLLEVLNIHSADLVERFEDEIEDKLEQLARMINDDL